MFRGHYDYDCGLAEDGEPGDWAIVPCAIGGQPEVAILGEGGVVYGIPLADIVAMTTDPTTYRDVQPPLMG